jgi:hypothetical protein
MRTLARLAVAAVLVGAPALAQPGQDRGNLLPSTSQVAQDHTLILMPGRRLSVSLDDKLVPSLSSEGAADALEFTTRDSDRKLETWGAATVGNAVIDTDRVRFNLYAFTRPPGSQQPSTALVVTNGRGKPLVYFAALVMAVEGRHVLRYTTICSIKPNQAGLETWGETVEAIMVLRIVEVDQPVCSDARTGKFYAPETQPPPPDPPAPKPN